MTKDASSTKFAASHRRDALAFFLLLTPLLFIASIGTIFHEFVFHAVEANPSINAGILISASFGVYLIIARMLDAQSDFRIIQRFGTAATEGVYMKTLLDEPWLKGRYVRHYLSHIANTGGTLSSQMEQSAIESELHALQADYNSRLELPQFLVGFMIAMGLLGTFIGLLETLTGISGMLDGMSGGGDVQKEFMKLVVELRKPLAGMGIAFSASMFGLICSLLLSIMMTLLRRYISRVVSLARNVMHDLTQMSRSNNNGSAGGVSLSPADIDSLLHERTETEPRPEPAIPMETFAPGPGVGIDPALSGRLDVLVKKIEILLDGVAANTENTKRTNELLGFGPRMKELSERTLEAIKGMASNHDIDRQLMRDLLESNVQARDAAIDNGRHLSEVKENFTRLCQSGSMVEMIASSLGGQGVLLESMLAEIRRSHQQLTAISRSVSGK